MCTFRISPTGGRSLQTSRVPSPPRRTTRRALASIPPADLDRLVTANAVYSLSERPPTSLTVANGVLTAGSKIFNQSHIGAVVSVVSGGTGQATITAIEPGQTTAFATINTPFSPA